MTKTSSADGPAGQRPHWLETVILLAMALAAVAFGAGLYIQSGIALASATIAGLALFLVMTASQTALTRAYHSAEAVSKVQNIEASMGGLSGDIERMGSIAARFENVEQLIEKVAGSKRPSKKSMALMPWARSRKSPRKS